MILATVMGLLLSPALHEAPPSRPKQPPGPPPVEHTSAAPTAILPPAAASGDGLPAPAPAVAASRPNQPNRQHQTKTPAPALATPPAAEPPPDTYQLWRRWQHLVEQRAYQQMPIANAQLAESLRNGDGAAIYQEIANLLRDDGLAFQVRTQLVELLGEIGTPEALGLLLRLAEQGMESPLYAPSLNTISHIGENRWGGRFHEELSPVLEQAWKSADNSDWPYLVAITRALVGIGAPSGIGLLLDTLAGKDTASSSTPTDDTTRKKQVVAFTETPNVANPAAVTVMKQAVIGTVSPRSLKDGGDAAKVNVTATNPQGTAAVASNPTDFTLSGAYLAIPNGDGQATTASTPTGTDPSGSQAQPAIVTVVVQGLENIGTDVSSSALSEIVLIVPDAKTYLTSSGTQPSQFPNGSESLP